MIDAYVRGRVLPQPEMIANLPRRDFATGVAHIKTYNRVDPGGIVAEEDDT